MHLIKTITSIDSRLSHAQLEQLLDLTRSYLNEFCWKFDSDSLSAFLQDLDNTDYAVNFCEDLDSLFEMTDRTTRSFTIILDALLESLI